MSDRMPRNMEQVEFEGLIDAANRCLQEAEAVVETKVLNREAIKTIRRTISVWEDMRRGVIKNVSINSYPVILRWKWNTMRRRRSLERNESDL